MPKPTTRTRARRLLMLFVSMLALAMTLSSTVSSAQASPPRSAAARSECYLYEPDCYHVVSAKTFSTIQSCRVYAIRYTPLGDMHWTKCTAQPPSGRVYLYVFFFTCPQGKSTEYCKLHHYT